MKKTLFSIIATLSINLSVCATETPQTDIYQKDFKVTLQWLEEKPKSYAKDFFILQFLNQPNLSFDEAKIAYEMGNENNTTLKKLFNEKFKVTAPLDLKCYRESIEELKNEDSKCIALGLSLQEATKISKSDLRFFISRLDSYPTLKNDLQILNLEDPSTTLVNVDSKKFLKFFFEAGDEFKTEVLNKKLNLNFLNTLSNEKDFEKFLKYVVFDKKLTNLQKSLFALKDSPNLEPNMLFLLGINAINNGNIDVAYGFFNNSLNKSYYRSDRDKALYWLYLVTKNRVFLDELAKSWDDNIYALYAKELLDIKLDNIIYNVDLKNKKSTYDVYDVFKWIEVSDDTRRNCDEIKLEKYSNIFTDERTLPQMAFVLERYNKYKYHYYITPYKDIMKNYDLNQQILIYSIAKQESLFIPTSISTTAAQGIMQIMPFLSSEIAKKLNEDYNIYEQFIPEKNIEYGSYHLNVLMQQFNNNPLFVAYAYNGGAGYTRNQLKKGLFKEKNRFEPFLSMEMISFAETREYGKKVLANYYIYNNYLNPQNPITLSTIFQSLVSLY